MTKTLLHNLLVKSAEAGLELQREDGSMPPGVNGPYQVKENPVSNTSYWIIIFLRAFEISGRKEFEEAVESAANYLINTEKIRPEGGAYWCIKDRRRNFTHGLMGQACVVESLMEAYKKLGNRSYKETAEELFLLHLFDEEVGLWKRVNIEGEVKTFDPTVDHQIWFAEAGSLFENQKTEIKNKVREFLNKLPKNMKTHESGLIKHLVNRNRTGENKIKLLLLELLKRLGIKPGKLKEIGYHTCILYPLSVIRQKFPEHGFWKSSKFEKTLNYLEGDEFLKEIRKSPYSFSHIPTGIELMYITEVFDNFYNGKVKKFAKNMLNKQFEEHFDFDKYLMNRNTSDPNSLAANLYEAARLGGEIEVEI